eukprot:CAMPEP_0171464206 /NCGR_PEP_ID=MMETSP0945-20130129/7597_1 /TAXON_ID=109269 /ORGANISM="Vaucheria litorea, Strain CCMP2940" /LENGTH=239 /DNA_ID=CAMNT_0011991207 /DNA_START=125 /DNA_END=841 /DNA_ORIENTATION=+
MYKTNYSFSNTKDNSWLNVLIDGECQKVEEKESGVSQLLKHNAGFLSFLSTVNSMSASAISPIMASFQKDDESECLPDDFEKAAPSSTSEHNEKGLKVKKSDFYALKSEHERTTKSLQRAEEELNFWKHKALSLEHYQNMLQKDFEAQKNRIENLEEKQRNLSQVISFVKFDVENIALFFPTPNGLFLAFNIGAPHFFLNNECKKLIGKFPHFQPFYILGKITQIEEKVSDGSDEYCFG